jgi:hypothetical protein
MSMMNADAVSSAELVMMSGNNNKEGSFHDEDVVVVDVEDRQISRDASGIINATRNNNNNNNNNNSNNEDEKTSGTYPADCYSFLALHSPFDHLGFW